MFPKSCHVPVNVLAVPGSGEHEPPLARILLHQLPRLRLSDGLIEVRVLPALRLVGKEAEITRIVWHGYTISYRRLVASIFSWEALMAT